MAKLSRFKPLTVEEAWASFVKTSERLKILGRLSDAEAQRISEAVDILKTPQFGKLKRYKEFLYDVGHNSSTQCVLLCIVALGQVKVTSIKNDDRVGLISKITANKDSTNINHSTIRSLAIRYIPSDLPPLVHTVVQRPGKRKRNLVDSHCPEQTLGLEFSTTVRGEVYEPTPNTAPAPEPEFTTRLAGDVYELAPEDAPAVLDQIRGQIWLTDPYDANTHQPFVTIPISWRLRNQFSQKRPRITR